MYLKLFLGTVFLGAAIAAPPSGQNRMSKCRLSQFQPPQGLPNGDFDWSLLPDPFSFRNYSEAVELEDVSGTYSFFNGLIEGLSTIAVNYDYSITRIVAGVTVKNIKLSGLYEIIDGKITSSLTGSHTLSGKGPLLIYGAGLNTTISFNIKTDPSTDYVTISDLSIDIGFDNITVSIANLVVDGVPIDWEALNDAIRPLFEALWLPTKATYEEMIEKEINDKIQGCTLIDLISSSSSKQINMSAMRKLLGE